MSVGGGLNQPAPSRSPQNTEKPQKKFFDFPKVHIEVTKFGTSRTLFSWRNGRLKIVRAASATPPRPNRVKFLFFAHQLRGNIHPFPLITTTNPWCYLFWSQLSMQKILRNAQK